MDLCFKLIFAYDGTGFCGWEKQAQGERTVRGIIEDGISRLTGREVSIAGAGRTDSGVHALGQVASFHLDKEIAEETLVKGLNAILPGDIRVLRASRVPLDFHARFSVRHKTYFYQIVEAPFDDPFRSRFLHRVRKLPGEAAIREAASLLVGDRDFAAMRASGADVKSSRRRILSIKVRRRKECVRIFFTGEGFLYRMVRNMVSFVMATADGSISQKRAVEILDSGDRTLAPPTYPAKGLFLWRVNY